jgi:hypothetical protein
MRVCKGRACRGGITGGNDEGGVKIGEGVQVGGGDGSACIEEYGSGWLHGWGLHCIVLAFGL